MTNTRKEQGPMAAGEPVDGWEPASRVEAAESEWALRQAELRLAGARLAALRRAGSSTGPSAEAGADTAPPFAPEPAPSALSDLALDILTGGSTARPGPAGGPAGPA
ncbi:hypothetical protein OG322_06295 [Streptomyces sp. NBC_01260]|uniref:hypothetical protein n=1 Tax=unclassified Streptomyces TaxID=2593676 RepID=UPI00225BD613|nr:MULTISPECIES: hypothetical protein [unclassified Streptomyces]MCX4769031.1 hypothetical protein [Streptomyces sp. NBC_01285]